MKARPILGRATTTIALLSLTCASAVVAEDRSLNRDDGEGQGQTAPASPQQTTTSDHDWHFTLTPYRWFAGASGTVGAFGHDASVHVSAGDPLSHFDIGLMAAMEAQRTRT